MKKKLKKDCLDNEKNLLGCLLLDNSLIVMSSELKAKDFLSEDHRKIYKRIRKRTKKNKDCTLLDIHNKYPEISAAYIASLLDGEVDISRFSYYRDSVRSHSLLRALKTASEHITKKS